MHSNERALLFFSKFRQKIRTDFFDKWCFLARSGLWVITNLWCEWVSEGGLLLLLLQSNRQLRRSRLMAINNSRFAITVITNWYKWRHPTDSFECYQWKWKPDLPLFKKSEKWIWSSLLLLLMFCCCCCWCCLSWWGDCSGSSCCWVSWAKLLSSLSNALCRGRLLFTQT